MDRLRAIKVLEEYNKYRRDNRVPNVYHLGDVKEIGRAIDYAISSMREKDEFPPRPFNSVMSDIMNAHCLQDLMKLSCEIEINSKEYLPNQISFANESLDEMNLKIHA